MGAKAWRSPLQEGLTHKLTWTKPSSETTESRNLGRSGAPVRQVQAPKPRPSTHPRLPGARGGREAPPRRWPMAARSRPSPPSPSPVGEGSGLSREVGLSACGGNPR